MNIVKCFLLILLLPKLSASCKSVTHITDGHKSFYNKVEVTDTTRTRVVYTNAFRQGDIVLKFTDTFYIAGEFILEPIKQYDFETFPNFKIPHDANGKVGTEWIKQDPPGPVVRTPTDYFITNWKLQAGMAFDLHTPAQFKKAFSTGKGNDKIFGYPLVNEFPVAQLLDSTPQLSEVKRKDTLINNQNFIALTFLPNSKTSFNNKPAILQKAVVLLDPLSKDLCFPFISRVLCERFGGAVVQVRCYYDQDQEAYFDYTYRKGFSKEDDAFMNKYIGLFQAHRSALDTLGRSK